jgi:hypothetical protein
VYAAQVTLTDIEASNGIIHEIDVVIIPVEYVASKGVVYLCAGDKGSTIPS